MGAKEIYLFALAWIALIVVVTLCLDFYLIHLGDKSMSTWLRARPVWFVWPAALIVIMLGGLAVHLFYFYE